MNFKLLLLIGIISITSCIYPVAIFHGIADHCESDYFKKLVGDLTRDLNTHVECIEIAGGFLGSIFKPLQKQVDEACEKINSNPYFQDKFSIFGLSQGTLISRYIIERCPMKGTVMRYMSLDGPQMGLGWIPKLTCGKFCDWIVELTIPIAYTLTNSLAPASYFRFRYDQDYYVENNVFLRELNNEIENKNPEIYKRFSSLEKVILIRNLKDTVITPVESSWFEFYDLDGNEIVPLKESDFYKEDWIGLRKLDEEGKVIFAEFSGEHVIYNIVEYYEQIVPFFSD